METQRGRGISKYEECDKQKTEKNKLLHLSDQEYSQGQMQDLFCEQGGRRPSFWGRLQIVKKNTCKNEYIVFTLVTQN